MNRDGTRNLTIAVSSDFSDLYEELKDSPVEVEVKRYRHRRSLEANRMAWVMIGQITEKLQLTDPKGQWTEQKVYRDALRDVAGSYTIVGMKNVAIDTFRRNWEKGHIGRQVVVLDGSSKDEWSNVKIYFGSSEFDTAQMSRLIYILIQQAESLGIPTITDKEAKKIVGYWKS